MGNYKDNGRVGERQTQRRKERAGERYAKKGRPGKGCDGRDGQNEGGRQQEMVQVKLTKDVKRKGRRRDGETKGKKMEGEGCEDHAKGKARCGMTNCWGRVGGTGEGENRRRKTQVKGIREGRIGKGNEGKTEAGNRNTATGEEKHMKRER